jgi:protein TonB
MKKILSLVFLLALMGISVSTFAQEEVIIQNAKVSEATPNDSDQVYVFVEDNPVFPGGDEARLKYISNNITYPNIAIESGIQGTVYVTFVVEKDGSISNVKVLRGIGGACDEEALRVIRNMPKWQAGKHRGKEIRVQYNLPIKFVLENDSPVPPKVEEQIKVE